MAPSNLFSFYSDILQNNLFPSLTHVCFCYDEYNDPMIQYTHRVFFFILNEHLWSAVAWHKPCFRCDIRITIKQKTRKYKWASRVCVMNYGTIFFSPSTHIRCDTTLERGAVMNGDVCCGHRKWLALMYRNTTITKKNRKKVYSNWWPKAPQAWTLPTKYIKGRNVSE